MSLIIFNINSSFLLFSVVFYFKLTYHLINFVFFETNNKTQINKLNLTWYRRVCVPIIMRKITFCNRPKRYQKLSHFFPLF
jgi:hypothetical protein